MAQYLFRSSLLYSFLKVFIGEITLPLFFRKIHVHGLDRVPAGKPVLLASSHSNAFMDALLIKATMTRPVYSLVRSDVFNTPFKLWLLGKMNMMPIYRLQEGADQLHKNEEVFRKCYRMLEEGKCLVIFSEGNCVQERRLRRLKKGTARIALGALEHSNFDVDLQIVCVGLSYDRPTQFKSEVHLRFSPPIAVQNYKEAFKNDSNKATTELTRDMEKGIAAEMVIIKNRETDELVGNIEMLYKKQLLEEFGVSDSSRVSDFDVTCGIAAAVNYFYEADKEKVMQLDGEVKKYTGSLKKHGLRDHLFDEANAHKNSAGNMAVAFVLLILGFPLHLLGLINNYLPYKLPSLLAKKIVRNVEFYTSINFGAGAFMFLLFYITQVTVVAALSHSILFTFLYAALLPFSAWFSLRYSRFWKKTKGRMAYRKLAGSDPGRISELTQLRKKIREQFESGKKEYLRQFPCH